MNVYRVDCQDEAFLIAAENFTLAQRKALEILGHKPAILNYTGPMIRVTSWGPLREPEQVKPTQPPGQGAHRLSVKDFGAIGDGVVDDSCAIEMCLTEAERRSGPDSAAVIVVFQPGRYLWFRQFDQSRRILLTVEGERP